TPSVPTPTLFLAADDAKRRLAALDDRVKELEAAGNDLRAARREAFEAWLAGRAVDGAVEFADLKAHFTFDELSGASLANGVEEGKPAALHGENKLVEGRFGKAVEFTGDD